MDVRKSLIAICHRFINCDDEINLAHMLDALYQAIPDANNQNRKDWARYMEELNEVWVRINREGENIPWPEPPSEKASHVIVEPMVPQAQSGLWKDVFGTDAEKRQRNEIRAALKLQLDGGNGVGPARVPKSAEERRKGGRTRDDLVDSLIIESKALKPPPNFSNETRLVVYCIGCDKMTVGRDAQRIRNHAKDCNELAANFSVLHRRVMKALVGRAHSTKLEKMNSEPELQQGSQAASQASSSSAMLVDTENDITEAKEQRRGAGSGILTYMNPARITEKQKLKIELLLFQMIICCALPWALLDNESFASFVLALAPNFVIPDRSAFFPKLISQEIAVWEEKFKEFLKGKVHLTLSLDGWSTRAKEEVYTFHTTTTKRRSFFTDGHVFRGVSVTGEALFNIAVKLLTTHDVNKYSAMVGDGGSNVRAAKIRIHKQFNWILNIYDPCHNLNLFLKDMGKLFKPTLSIVSGIANYFGKSNYGTFHLDEQRKKEGIAEGVKSCSETRFSSSYIQVISVQTCMNAIKKCVQTGKLKFDTAATKKLLPYIMDGGDHFRFMIQMSGFAQLLSSGANAILTLEGQNTTCADVFYAWVCIAHHLENVLASPAIEMGHLRGEVVKIYNHRFNQMMTESSHHLFFLAYYLHPMFHHHGGLQLTMPALIDGQPPPMRCLPDLFKLLLASVLNIFHGEQQRLQDGGVEMVQGLIDELLAYAYNKEPFRGHTWTRATKPLKWWTEISKDSNARLIARIAIKLFSISPSEICDERTASRLGWFNAARRSSITPEHLIDSTKLYDFYVNGFNEGKYTHTARIHLTPVNQSAPNPSNTAPAVRSAPSLMDLLNADNIEPANIDIAAEEQQLFNHPDPYDLDETERVDEALRPHVVRSSLSFDITEYIKFDDPKLTALIMKVDADGPGASLTQQGQSQQTTPTGKPGEWSVDSFLGLL